MIHATGTLCARVPSTDQCKVERRTARQDWLEEDTSLSIVIVRPFKANSVLQSREVESESKLVLRGLVAPQAPTATHPRGSRMTSATSDRRCGAALRFPRRACFPEGWAAQP